MIGPKDLLDARILIVDDAPANVLMLERILRGAGYTHDGSYYVKSVTHNISKGQYKQSFTLTREGVGAISPTVIA